MIPGPSTLGIGFWHYWPVKDLLVAAVVGALAILFRRLSRREHWRVALREVRRRRLAVVSFYVILLYLAIALLDSVGWHQVSRDENGQPMRDNAGAVIRDSNGLSALDALLTPLRAAREKTYSAPLARRQFLSEIVVGPDGVPRQEFPPLQHPGRHLLGTDKVGNDVLYVALKGVRTGVIVGGLTMLLAIPFAIFFGIAAGYFGGWVDDVIQYLYTTLASIPGVLLIISLLIIMKERGLFQICFAMGIKSWTGLCRVLRGETMKLRETEFVQAAQAMGTPVRRILARHILPNVLHVVLISAVLGFSGLVLAEAVLTYIGIGIGPDTFSWGKMINDARLELARDPAIWWKLTAAFAFMLGLVLPVNIFGDTLRDALDPRLRTQ